LLSYSGYMQANFFSYYVRPTQVLTISKILTIFNKAFIYKESRVAYLGRASATQKSLSRSP
jgi:hypothetical protein